MISVEEAKKLISQNIHLLNTKLLSIDKCESYVLAQDVFSQVDVPFYSQSSMDGYAFHFDSLSKTQKLKIVGKIQAGSNENFNLEFGEAMRIFTGAPVPKGADTVVMQEKSKVENDFLFVEDINLKKGDNIRLKSSEIKRNDLALKKGTLIKPAGIGFLASIGIKEIEVYSKPIVSILVTGNELQEIGNELKFGQVYESNSHTVKSALQQMGISSIHLFKVDDNLENIIEVLQKALENSNIILFTGGISVGEFDFVFQATEACGVKKIFHKVKQKPGKPIYFGMKNEKVIFGLPGNPSSVLTCFYQYVTLAIDKLTGSQTVLKKIKLPLAQEYRKPLGLTHFLKAFYNEEQVSILEGQESYKLKSFAHSNCLVVLPETIEKVMANELVEINIIP